MKPNLETFLEELSNLNLCGTVKIERNRLIIFHSFDEDLKTESQKSVFNNAWEEFNNDKEILIKSNFLIDFARTKMPKLINQSIEYSIVLRERPKKVTRKTL